MKKPNEEELIMEETKEKQDQVKYAVAAVLAVLVFVIIYKYSLNQINCDGIDDLKEHLWHAEDIYLTTLWTSWLERPYLFWHITVKCFIKFFGYPSDEAGACTCACYAVLNYYIMLYIIDRIAAKSTGRNVTIAAAFAAALLSLVQPLYVWWFNSYQYEGQFSINPIFNPTQTVVKPFGLLAFMFAVDLILQCKGKETIFVKGERTKKLLYVFFAVDLLASAFAKPTFMFMLLPAGAVYLLVDLAVHLFRKDGSWRATWNLMWKIACACIPTLVYLIFQYAAFYLWGGTNEDAKVAIYPFLTAWHLYSIDVPTSIVLGMLFPIWMVLTHPVYFFKSVEGRLSCICYAVGTLEFSFIVETGSKLVHLNFSWPMMSGMLLLWVVCGAKLVECTYAAKPGKGNAVIVTIGWFFLALHLLSGFYYINPYAYII